MIAMRITKKYYNHLIVGYFYNRKKDKQFKSPRTSRVTTKLFGGRLGTLSFTLGHNGKGLPDSEFFVYNSIDENDKIIYRTQYLKNAKEFVRQKIRREKNRKEYKLYKKLIAEYHKVEEIKQKFNMKISRKTNRLYNKIAKFQRKYGHHEL